MMYYINFSNLPFCSSSFLLALMNFLYKQKYKEKKSLMSSSLISLCNGFFHYWLNYICMLDREKWIWVFFSCSVFNGKALYFLLVVGCRFSYMFFFILKNFPLIPICWQFASEKMFNLSKAILHHWDDYVIFLCWDKMLKWMTLIKFLVLSPSYVSWRTSIWSWHIILLIYCCTWFASILLRISTITLLF